jgi:diguanylate cyclase
VKVRGLIDLSPASGEALKIEIPALSPEAGRSVLVGAAAITLASAAASEVITFLISITFNIGADLPAYLVAGLIPILLAGPGSYFQLKRFEQVRQAYRELERATRTDWLTNCLNRRAFTAAVSTSTQIGTPGALLLIDVDDLKSINDRFGHEYGDEALRSIAAVVNNHVCSSDFVGKLGGEEFGVYLRVATDRHASAIAEAIREGVEDIALASEDVPLALSVSIGIAAAATPVTFSELFRVADEQLSVAKTNGRNRVAITTVEAVVEDQAA